MAFNYLRDCVVGLILVAASLFIYFYLTPEYVAEGSSLGMSPRFFPNLGAFVIAVMGLSLSIVSIIFFSRSEGSWSAELKRAVRLEFIPVLKGPLLTVLAFSFLFFTFEYYGYIFSIPPSLLLLMLLFGQRGWTKLIVVPLVVPAILFVLFNYGLNMPLD